MTGNADQAHGSIDVDLFRIGSPDAPLPAGQELVGDLDPFRLDILGQGYRHGAGLCRVHQYSHPGQQCAEHLLRSLDPVEEPAYRAEEVSEGDARIVG